MAGVGSGLRFVHVVKAGILLILFPGGGLAAIAFLAEGEIQVVAGEADPVSLPGHGGEDEAIISVFGWGGVGSHFEF